MQFIIDAAERGLLLESFAGDSAPFVTFIRNNRPTLKDKTEWAEVDATYRAAYRRDEGYEGMRVPYRAPHHSISLTGFSGKADRPGELALAHRGILIIDELPEFSRACHNVLLDALANKVDAHGRAFKPLMVVATTKSTPCSKRKRDCKCSPAFVRRYQERIDPFRPFLGYHIRCDRTDQRGTP